MSKPRSSVSQASIPKSPPKASGKAIDPATLAELAEQGRQRRQRLLAFLGQVIAAQCRSAGLQKREL